MYFIDLQLSAFYRATQLVPWQRLVFKKTFTTTIHQYQFPPRTRDQDRVKVSWILTLKPISAKEPSWYRQQSSHTSRQAFQAPCVSAGSTVEAGAHHCRWNQSRTLHKESKWVASPTTFAPFFCNWSSPKLGSREKIHHFTSSWSVLVGDLHAAYFRPCLEHLLVAPNALRCVRRCCSVAVGISHTADKGTWGLSWVWVHYWPQWEWRWPGDHPFLGENQWNMIWSSYTS